MKIAVVGHLEWADLALVERVPQPGEIVHASRIWEQPAGGAAVAAAQIAKLNSGCLFFTANGNDERGDRAVSGLEALGLTVETVSRETAQRRAFVYLDADGDRTITTIGERTGPRADDPLPWSGLDGADAVYFTSGDAAALRLARSAKQLVASVRTGTALSDSEVQLDVLVASANDEGERYQRGDINPVPRAVVMTDGSRGGSLERADGTVTHWTAEPPNGPKVDTYGAGDTFAGGLTYGLALGFPIETAIALGAFCGASAVTGRGPYEGHVSADELLDWEERTGVRS